jgi:hypothetical protein
MGGLFSQMQRMDKAILITFTKLPSPRDRFQHQSRSDNLRAMLSDAPLGSSLKFFSFSRELHFILGTKPNKAKPPMFLSIKCSVMQVQTKADRALMIIRRSARRTPLDRGMFAAVLLHAAERTESPPMPESTLSLACEDARALQPSKKAKAKRNGTMIFLLPGGVPLWIVGLATAGRIELGSGRFRLIFSPSISPSTQSCVCRT